MADRLNYRILEIDFETDDSDNDIRDITAVTYFRSGQSRTAGNGFSVTPQVSDLEGGTKQELNGADLASAEVWLWFGEQLPGFNIIVLSNVSVA